MIYLRMATPADSEDLFAWRNDPDTCANSRSTAQITRAQHDQWMKFNVSQGYPEHMVLIPYSEFRKVGVVRFDADKRDIMSYEVSITLAPAQRGKGLAAPSLLEACSRMPEYGINAQVRKDNAASRRTFERCGFDLVGTSSEGLLQYRREPMS